jgi:hypothetical protein
MASKNQNKPTISAKKSNFVEEKRFGGWKLFPFSKIIISLIDTQNIHKGCLLIIFSQFGYFLTREVLEVSGKGCRKKIFWTFFEKRKKQLFLAKKAVNPFKKIFNFS